MRKKVKSMKTCNECGKSEGRIIFSKKRNCYLCNACYLRDSNYNDDYYAPPPRGEIHYSSKGNPICHECGMAYRKLMAHVWQVHKMNEKEYKEKHGLNSKAGIACENYKEKMRKYVEIHYDKVVKKNLLEGGQETRFEIGSQGRTRDKIREQTMKELKQQSFIKRKVSGLNDDS